MTKRKGAGTTVARGPVRPKREPSSIRRAGRGVTVSTVPEAVSLAADGHAPALGPREADRFAGCRALIRDVPDFPTPGILFKDITPLLASPRAFHTVLDALAERFLGEHVDAIVGIEARGFIFGGALAARLNASFVPARKPGKLPAACDRVQYQTEYSLAELEMHRSSLQEEARVVVVDDVLATGGTAKAAAELVRQQNAHVVAYAFVLELGFLGGRERLLPVRVESVLAY